jgi:glycosyltransferase involved in cell wall biosynthesis
VSQKQQRECVQPSAPCVSVGLPFYNAASTLAGAIRSVFAQTYQDWELILVDDGSSDGSLEIAQMVKDPRVRVLSDGQNRGLCARLNEIASLARGRLIARMDADDLMHPERIAKQVTLLDARPDVDVVGTATYTTDAQWMPTGIRGSGPLDTTLAQVLRRGLFIHPTVMARVEWVRTNHYRSEYRRAEDLELWCRTCQSMRAALVSEPLHFYREPVPISMAAYLETCRTARRIARRFGPAALGRTRTLTFILRQHLAGVIYRMSGPLHLQSWLLQRRSISLSATQRNHALAMVRRVLETRLPGLDAAPLAMTSDAGWQVA